MNSCFLNDQDEPFNCKAVSRNPPPNTACIFRVVRAFRGEAVGPPPYAHPIWYTFLYPHHFACSVDLFLENIVFERILTEIRDKIRLRQFIMTVHAEEEMNDDELSIFDLERCVLTGEITERQEDKETGEWKYVVEGQSVTNDKIVVVVKISPTGKLVFITTYRS